MDYAGCADDNDQAGGPRTGYVRVVKDTISMIQHGTEHQASHTTQRPPIPRPIATIAPDCRHYQGDRPCVHNRLCRGCSHYDPYTQRICVIKLGALGDVIRTLCLLPGLRESYPNAHITWVTLPNAARMLDGHTMIDRLLPFNQTTTLVLPQERFDLAINLDKEPEPCALAKALFAKLKLGIGLSDYGTAVPVNDHARDYFHLGLSDDLKFNKNTKSYPRLIYEALGLTYNSQRYELPLDNDTRDIEQQRLQAMGWSPDAPTLGINVGAAGTFVNKMWGKDRILQLIRALHDREMSSHVLLLGGANERDTMEYIAAQSQHHSRTHPVFNTGHDNSERSFTALVDLCDTVFTGDTMAMHVAIARRKGLVVFFGPTCNQEIDLFGLGEKLVAKVPCGPCYKRECDQDDACLTDVSVDDAVSAVARVMRRANPVRAAAPIPLRIAG